MDTDAIKQGLQRMADDMIVAGEPIAIDKVVERHLATLRAARDFGLRWGGIARLIQQSVVAGEIAHGVSAPHLRASYSRAMRKADVAKSVAMARLTHIGSCRDADAGAVETSRSPATASTSLASRAAPKPAIPNPNASHRPATDPTDLSDAELAAARQRLS